MGWERNRQRVPLLLITILHHRDTETECPLKAKVTLGKEVGAFEGSPGEPSPLEKSYSLRQKAVAFELQWGLIVF